MSLRLVKLFGPWLAALLATGCVIYTTEQAPTHSGRQPRSHRPPPQPRPMAQPASTTQPAQHPKLLTSPSVAKPAPALLVPPSSLPAQPPKDEPPHSSGRPQSLPEGSGMGRP